MIKLLALAALSITFITACEDSYRYACQDPANFNKKECQVPDCESDGTCTKYLVPEEAIKEHIEGDKK